MNFSDLNLEKESFGRQLASCVEQQYDRLALGSSRDCSPIRVNDVFVGGSFATGTAIPSESDLDIRFVVENRPPEHVIDDIRWEFRNNDMGMCPSEVSYIDIWVSEEEDANAKTLHLWSDSN